VRADFKNRGLETKAGYMRRVDEGRRDSKTERNGIEVVLLAL
jgi:hypothetical protein